MAGGPAANDAVGSPEKRVRLLSMQDQIGEDDCAETDARSDKEMSPRKVGERKSPFQSHLVV